jgi:hypothetical protein
VKEVFRTPALRRAFRLGVGLQALQQLSGINTIMCAPGGRVVSRRRPFEARRV